ncbi:MAG: hypothetical protein ABH954_04525 [Candidatus Omnitrophota bacterium]
MVWGLQKEAISGMINEAQTYGAQVNVSLVAELAPSLPVGRQAQRGTFPLELTDNSRDK